MASRFYRNKVVSGGEDDSDGVIYSDDGDESMNISHNDSEISVRSDPDSSQKVIGRKFKRIQNTLDTSDDSDDNISSDDSGDEIRSVFNRNNSQKNDDRKGSGVRSVVEREDPLQYESSEATNDTDGEISSDEVRRTVNDKKRNEIRSASDRNNIQNVELSEDSSEGEISGDAYDSYGEIPSDEMRRTSKGKKINEIRSASYRQKINGRKGGRIPSVVERDDSFQGEISEAANDSDGEISIDEVRRTVNVTTGNETRCAFDRSKSQKNDDRKGSRIRSVVERERDDSFQSEINEAANDSDGEISSDEIRRTPNASEVSDSAASENDDDGETIDRVHNAIEISGVGKLSKNDSRYRGKEIQNAPALSDNSNVDDSYGVETVFDVASLKNSDGHVRSSIALESKESANNDGENNYSNESISGDSKGGEEVDVQVVFSDVEDSSNSSDAQKSPDVLGHSRHKLEKTNEPSIEHEMMISTPPTKFVPPLARSSMLPVPNEMIPKKELQCTTKMIAVPNELLEKRRNVASARSIDEDSDCLIISSSEETSSIESAQKVGIAKKMPTFIAETDDSSSGFATAPEDSSTEEYSKTSAKTSFQAVEKSSSSLRSIGSVNNSSESELTALRRQLNEKNAAYRSLLNAQRNCNPKHIKDGGRLLHEKVERYQLELKELKARIDELSNNSGDADEIEVVSVKQNIIFSSRDQDTANLGKKGLETHRIQQALTMDALVNLHSGLATTPTADSVEEPPSGLLVDLLPHQLHALTWLLHREKQTPAGGILADDMGLGKTLSMIALVMRSAELKENEEPDEARWTSRRSGHPGKTLVICPASLIGQWEGQVKQHVRRGRLSTLVHHGTNREGRGRALTNADIVITTYGVVASECKEKEALFRVEWERIILDEAHTIRNPKTQTAVATCELQGRYRWCLTGTPFHNKELDVYSLLKFLRCSPFDDLSVWKRWVDNKSPQGVERLNTIMKSILLRRTKEELKQQGKLNDLPTREVHDIRIALDQYEMTAYECVLNFSKNLMAQYLQQRAEKSGGGFLSSGMRQHLNSQMQHIQEIKTHEILVLLLRLRQICCLPGLITAMLEADAADTDGFGKEDPVVEDLFRQVRRLTISALPPEEAGNPQNNEPTKILNTANPVFAMDRESSKMKIVVEKLQNIISLGDKVVVVSQWPSFLRSLSVSLKSMGIKTAILDGSVPVKDRGSLVDAFNNPNSRLRCLLLSLTAGGVGLNLVGGNHLVIMEPHWNPQLESQACDRIYRVGQKKPVHIYKMICSDTIEERIETLQKRKLELSDKVLTGQIRKELKQLTLQDIKSLFEL